MSERFRSEGFPMDPIVLSRKNTVFEHKLPLFNLPECGVERPSVDEIAALARRIERVRADRLTVEAELRRLKKLENDLETVLDQKVNEFLG